MNKKNVILLILIIILFVLSFVLFNILDKQFRVLEIASAMFLLSVFCLFEYNNALKLKKTGIGASINFTKKHYQKRGELQKYQNITKRCLVVTFGLGIITLIFGLIEISIYYINLFCLS